MKDSFSKLFRQSKLASFHPSSGQVFQRTSPSSSSSVWKNDILDNQLGLKRNILHLESLKSPFIQLLSLNGPFGSVPFRNAREDILRFRIIKNIALAIGIKEISSSSNYNNINTKNLPTATSTNNDNITNPPFSTVPSTHTITSSSSFSLENANTKDQNTFEAIHDITFWNNLTSDQIRQKFNQIGNKHLKIRPSLFKYLFVDSFNNANQQHRFSHGRNLVKDSSESKAIVIGRLLGPCDRGYAVNVVGWIAYLPLSEVPSTLIQSPSWFYPYKSKWILFSVKSLLINTDSGFPLMTLSWIHSPSE